MKAQKQHNLFLEALSEEDFSKNLNIIIERIKTSLQVKAAEYVRNGDRLHNFNTASKKKGITREQVIDNFRLKHEVSIDDMRNDIELGLTPDEDIVSEKFKDIINYYILEEISIMHRLNINKDD